MNIRMIAKYSRGVLHVVREIVLMAADKEDACVQRILELEEELRRCRDDRDVYAASLKDHQEQLDRVRNANYDLQAKVDSLTVDLADAENTIANVQLYSAVSE